jgi:transposase InsO family protein
MSTHIGALMSDRSLKRSPRDTPVKVLIAAVWLTDITEHWAAEGKRYLRAVKDCWSNKIVGYSRMRHHHRAFYRPG